MKSSSKPRPSVLASTQAQQDLRNKLADSKKGAITDNNMETLGLKYKKYGLDGVEKNISLIWSITVVMLNVYTLFLTVYWWCTPGLPENDELFIDILVELILALEILVRIYLRIFKKTLYVRLNLYHNRRKDSCLRLLVIVIGSIP